MRSRPSLSARVAGSVVALVCAAVLPAQSDEERQETPEVEELAFRGVNAVDASELRESIATRASRCRSVLVRVFCLFSDARVFVERHYLDRAELERDLTRIRVAYWRRGYRWTRVKHSVTPAGAGMEVTFIVEEGPPTLISSIRVARRDTLLTDRDIERSMRLKAGDPLNLFALDTSLVRIRDRLWAMGYADAAVEVDTIVTADTGRRAVIVISAEPNRRTTVETISILGNRKIGDRTIRNSLLFRPGDVFRPSQVIESQRNLYESNLFSRAEVLVPPQQDSAKLVEVLVQEAPLRAAQLSAGFNTIDFVQVAGEFTNYNFYGRARRLSLRGVLGNLLAPQLNGIGIFEDVTPTDLDGNEERQFLRPTWQGSIDLTWPWFGSSRNTFGATVFTHRRSAPAIFIDQGYGAGASFSRRLTRSAPASASYRFEITEVQAGDVYFCQNVGVCDVETIDALRGQQRLAPVGLSFFSGRTDALVSPSSGYGARLDLEHASSFTLSEFRYNRILGETTRYRSVLGNSVLAVHGRFGWVEALASTRDALGIPSGAEVGIIHPRKRFYAGGSQSVRGYGENQLGPRILTVDPQELLDAGCTPASIADRSCDPNVLDGADAFTPRPIGGTSIIEGNIELRFPILQQLSGAVFVDAALLGEGPISELAHGTGAITPGFGIRYQSPVGPIRVDLGIRPTLAERLPVATQFTDDAGNPQLVTLTQLKRYDPVEGSSNILRQIVNRLNLHLSIGEAF